MRIKNWLHYLLLVVVFIFFTFAFSSYLQNDNVIRESLSGQYSGEIINRYLESKRKWAWLGYAFVPILILIRTSIIAFLMQITTFFMEPDAEDEPEFSRFWSVTLFAEWAMLLFVAFKFVWFAFIQTEYTLEDLQGFNFGSLSSILDLSNLDDWLLYPLSLVSLWELLYWVFLIIGIQDLFKTTYWRSFIIVLASYGIGLVIWVIFIMYLLLNAS